MYRSTSHAEAAAYARVSMRCIAKLYSDDAGCIEHAHEALITAIRKKNSCAPLEFELSLNVLRTESGTYQLCYVRETPQEESIGNWEFHCLNQRGTATILRGDLEICIAPLRPAAPTPKPERGLQWMLVGAALGFMLGALVVEAVPRLCTLF